MRNKVHGENKIETGNTIAIIVVVVGVWLMFRPIIDRVSKALSKKIIHRESGGIEFE